ncbi:MAG: hypothetical protein M3Q46_01225, partial [Verrucomicrobiota bacterium]|nr:hypothetical protein [Verrucomicrobiota bacterium]
MNFSRAPALVFLVLVLVIAGCRRDITAEERTARGNVRQALHERAFARAIPLARKVLLFAPNDDGAWARLAQAQYGRRDLTGLRQTLTEWPSRVKRPSAKYHEYRGDLARAESRPADALAAWTESVASKDRKLRVFIKIARLEQKVGHWAEAAAAWTRGMKDHPTAPALINRAICYRRLHSWDAALADVRHAAQLAPDDPVVREEHALLDRLGKFLAEVRDLDRDLAAHPQDASLLADRTLLFLRAGDATLAFDDASKAAQLAPGAVRPKLFRALAAHQLGRKTPELATPGTLRLESLSSDFLQTISRLDAEIEAEPKNAELLTNR